MFCFKVDTNALVSHVQKWIIKKLVGIFKKKEVFEGNDASNIFFPVGFTYLGRQCNFLKTNMQIILSFPHDTVYIITVLVP